MDPALWHQLYVVEPMQRAAAQAALNAQLAAVERERQQTRTAGALCEVDDLRSDGSPGLCRVAAVGRCARCHKAYCESHRAGALVLAFCSKCRQTAAAARAQAEQAEARAKKDAEELAEREHAATVARHEDASGWAEVRHRHTELTTLLARDRSSRHDIDFLVGLTALICLVVLIVAIISLTRDPSSDARGVAQGCLVVCLPLPLWVAWVLFAKARRSAWAREYWRLDRARGCGQQGCPRCAATRQR